MPIHHIILISLLIIAALLNLIACFFFGYDKWLAIRNARSNRTNRISEKSLLLLLFLGPLGGLLGMKLFRHKTSKPSFKWRAILALLLSLIIYSLTAYAASLFR